MELTSDLVKKILFSPSRVFRKLGKEENFNLAFMLFLAGAILYAAADMLEFGMIDGTRTFIRDIFSFYIGSAVVSFVAVRLGGKANWKKTMATMGFANIPNIFGGVLMILSVLIGVAELVFASIIFMLWAMVLGIIGIREVHRISTGRAITAMFLVPAILMAVALAIMLPFLF